IVPFFADSRHNLFKHGCFPGAGDPADIDDLVARLENKLHRGRLVRSKGNSAVPDYVIWEKRRVLILAGAYVSEHVAFFLPDSSARNMALVIQMDECGPLGKLERLAKAHRAARRPEQLAGNVELMNHALVLKG